MPPRDINKSGGTSAHAAAGRCAENVSMVTRAAGGRANIIIIRLRAARRVSRVRVRARVCRSTTVVRRQGTRRTI